MATLHVPRTTSAQRELALDANERAWSLTDGESIDLGCECGREACPETVHMPRLVYVGIRRSGAGFIVVPGHERLGTERVTQVGESYAVVERRAARPGDLATDRQGGLAS